MTTKAKYLTVKINEEAKIASEMIRANYRPDTEMQDIYSQAILGYVHAYYPSLEAEIAETMQRRQAARRGETAGHHGEERPQSDQE